MFLKTFIHETMLSAIFQSLPASGAEGFRTKVFVSKFLQFRNRVSVSLNESKASYFYNYFQQNSNNMKQLWSGIKSVISIKKSSKINVINKLKNSNGNI